MKRNIIAIAVLLCLLGCQNQKSNDRNESADVASSEVNGNAPLDTAVVEKIIKTADMRFRVKDVQHTKEQLSAEIKKHGGAVAEFSIESIIQETDKVKQSTDSLKEITAYRKEGYLVAKVPAEKLDDFTNTIAHLAVFVDQQSMKMDDQSINYLANKWKAQNRIEGVGQLNKVATKKGADVQTGIEVKDAFVDRKIENLSIDSRVKFSTITLNFYQNNTVRTMTIANDNLYDYRPNFANRLWLNILNGWTIFKEMILALANLWMLVILGIAIFFGVKQYRAKRAG
jgi:uncharacterized lipoprotein NlpE involved in copper resistance